MRRFGSAATGLRKMWRALFRCALAMTILCLVGSPPGADEYKFEGELKWPPGADIRAVRLLNLYAVYCVIVSLDSEAQSQALQQAGMEQLKGDLTMFLGEGPGQVWGASDATGGFVVALSDARGCTVFAEHVTIADAERLFAYMSTKMPIMIMPPHFEPPPLTKILDKLSDDQLTHMIRYETDVPDSDVSIWFTLATFKNPKASAQAFANVTRVRKE